MMRLSQHTSLEKRRITRLVEDNERLIHWVLGKYFSEYLFTPDYDDLVQLGRMTLFHCAKKFDADLGWKFSTYATTSLLRNIKRETELLKRNGFEGVCCPIVDSIDEYIDERETATFANKVVGREEDITDRLTVQELLTKLHPRYRGIIHDRYLLGKTYKEISRSLGISQERIRQIEKDGMNKLRQMVAV